MQRTTAWIGLGAMLITLGGCSVFGIATKDELDQAMQREAAQQRILEDRLDAAQNRLAAVREDLDSLGQRLGPQIADLAGGIDDLAADLEAVRERMAVASAEWSSLRNTMIADLDTLNLAYDRMQQDVVSVRTGIDTVALRAARAELRSREALRIHYDNLVAERERLLLRLQELDAHLQELESESDTELVPADPELSAAAGPAKTSSVVPVETGKIEIRTVKPEEPAPRARSGERSAG